MDGIGWMGETVWIDERMDGPMDGWIDGIGWMGLN